MTDCKVRRAGGNWRAPVAMLHGEATRAGRLQTPIRWRAGPATLLLAALLVSGCAGLPEFGFMLEEPGRTDRFVLPDAPREGIVLNLAAAGIDPTRARRAGRPAAGGGAGRTG